MAKRAHSPDGSSEQVFRSSSITDRQSIFVAHYSPTLSARALQAHPDFKTATHRIAAWRRPSSQRSVIAHSQRVLDIGHDDDGESYAGKKLEKLLEALRVEGAVCVARWYGGVMLGPVRFDHIENSARQAIHAWRTAATHAEQQKRQKVADAKLKHELERMLAERDQSIQVLRSLLTEKRKAASKDNGTPQPPAAAPVKAMDYSKMPVEALRKLEKARDASISFILKEIDKVEAQINEAAPAEPVRNESSVDKAPPNAQEVYGKKDAPADVDYLGDSPLDDALIEAAKQAEGGGPTVGKTPSKAHENATEKDAPSDMDSAFEDSLPEDAFIEAVRQAENAGEEKDSSAEMAWLEESLPEGAFIDAAKQTEDAFKAKTGDADP